jgi:hypothetical protein
VRHHTAWLKARLSSIAALRTGASDVPADFVKVFVTLAEYPKPHDDVKVLPPYIVLHPTDGNATRSRMSGGRRRKSPRWVVHSVGASAAQAGWLGEAVEQALVPGGVPVRPAIEGENTFPFWWNSPTPVELDRDSAPPVFLHISECGFDTDLTDP